MAGSRPDADIPQTPQHPCNPGPRARTAGDACTAAALKSHRLCCPPYALCARLAGPQRQTRLEDCGHPLYTFPTRRSGPCVQRPAVLAPRIPVAILVPVLRCIGALLPSLHPGSARAFRPLRPPPSPFPRAPVAALALPAAPAEAACALCQRAAREPVLADCGHRFCRACVVRFWAEEDGPFPCPECADDCWQRAVEPGRPPLSRRLLALEEAAAAPARDGPASEAALQLLCRADAGPLCAACRMAAGPEPPEWEPRWRKALRGKENKGSVEIMRKDLNDARDLHGQAESAAAVWKGHVMDRRKKALTDYKKLRTFFVEEEERFLQEAEKEEGSPEDEDSDPAERFRSLLQALSDLERRHRNLGLSMLLQ
ncbi:E3 ubiquitin-protein ligase RNF187 [Rhinolophus ferrumequinum]|nr:E3 ubiquitin-protein ligase RNF187 [Rhinolophus ferrumequinum]